MTTKTFKNKEEPMIALLQGEKWELNEDNDYILVNPKKKTVSLALFTCYDLTFKRWCTPYINESLEDYKTFFDSESYINHHEIPNTRYEQEVDE